MNSGGDDRHACPALVPDGGDYLGCGLLLGHVGACAPHVGDYLPPPMLHPLDARLVAVRGRAGEVLCPYGHVGAWFSPLPGRRWWVEPSVGVEMAAAYRRFEGGSWVAPETEALWRFEPCGCEFRQVLGSAGA